MPFIGRDWRSNGEQWTKTALGSWERSRQISLSNSLNTCLSDIFNALDIKNSVCNIRRFNYIAKVVQILFKEKLGELSGNAQRYLFQILEQMINTVLKTGNNIPLMQRIINQFHTSIHSAYPFYYYIGSEPLWRQHIDKLTRMKERLKTLQDPRKFPFDSLPIEIQCEIMKKLDNGKDLMSIGLSNKNFYYVTQELLLWKQLCHHHFGEQTKTNSKVIFDLMKQQSKEFDKDNLDWKKVYFKLKKRYGHREIYAEMINQCQACKTFVWQEAIHSCPYETLSPSFLPLTPRKFVNMLI